ncbi:MAG TPA: methyltransferase domain-containing protein [Ilumatobacter sp.]|nr:methyltransferase domain-containing protein [Ilumatobacter sp.]
MDADEYARMAAAGAQHWWYRASRRLLDDIMSPLLSPVDSSTVYLDAAGGSGATGSWLAERAPTLVDDVDQQSVSHAATHVSGYVPVLANLNDLPHPDDSFDAVLCVTALCHRMNTNPTLTVAELARVTKPGGIVCLMEPGVRKLRRGHDIVTHTARRFSRHDLAGLLHEAGLDVKRRTGAYTFLVPPAAALAVIERGKATSDVGRNESGMGGLFASFARAERALLRRVDLPTGLSAIAVAIKPG